MTRSTRRDLPDWTPPDEFRRRMVQVRTDPASIAAAPDPKRLLVKDDYFRIILFGLLNPGFGSMRWPRAARKITGVQGGVSSRPVSLGSLSEAQSVFDPELLEGVVSRTLRRDGRHLGEPRLAHLDEI